jgi:hypothetical protein
MYSVLFINDLATRGASAGAARAIHQRLSAGFWLIRSLIILVHSTPCIFCKAEPAASNPAGGIFAFPDRLVLNVRSMSGLIFDRCNLIS